MTPRLRVSWRATHPEIDRVSHKPALNGDPSLVAAHRALTELRCGRALVIRRDAQDDGLLLAALETADIAQVERLRSAASGPLQLAVTTERAHALGLDVALGQALHWTLPPTLTAENIAQLSQDWRSEPWRVALSHASHSMTTDERVLAALRLIKHAQLLPAALLAAANDHIASDDALHIDLVALQRFQYLQDTDIQRISEARVPLRDCEDSRLVLFRDRRDGTEHVAIQVGHPDPTQAIPLRLHSSCMTGDLLGSLRCDCGEQLNAAVQRLAGAGGGLLLYLAQEGRGIGLANKLRAYQLQDEGLDTIDADLQLGFSSDERSYSVAAAMLRNLQVPTVRLLTNSPHKVRSLREAGIDVAEIGTLPCTPNPHNARYIRTKQERAGHFSPPVDDQQD